MTEQSEDSPDESTADTEAIPEELSIDLRALLREVARGQARALIFEHLAEQVLQSFAAVDGGRPKLLLKVASGGAFVAEVDDLIEIESELLRLAGFARARVRQLLRAKLAAPVPPESDCRAPSIPLPSEPGEGVVGQSVPRGRKAPVDPGWNVLGAR